VLSSIEIVMRKREKIKEKEGPGISEFLCKDRE
jgi:hypothetical protein